jgi:DNA replication protein DnaC
MTKTETAPHGPLASCGPAFTKIADRFEKMTPEERRQRESDRQRFEEQAMIAKVQELHDAMNAPKRHLDCKPKLDGEWGKKLALLTTKIGTGFTVALVGTRGNGKTQMAIQLMLDATSHLLPCRFCTAAEFFMEIKATYRKDSEQSEQDVIKKYRRFKLLAIDEIGKRSDSEWENTLLFELLNKRYNDLTDTVLIDNRAKGEFIAAIGPSLASRIDESGGIIECDWPSFRE